MTRKSKKEQALETRDRILNAAEDVFYEKGVSSTSLADIAKSADVTRGAIYWHFKNKSDLFDAMCDRVREPMHNMILNIADAQSEDPLNQLIQGGLFFIEELISNPRNRKVFTIVHHRCEYLNENDPIFIYQKEWKLHILSHLEKVLAYAQSRNLLPADLDLSLASLVLHMSFSGLLNTWFFIPERFDLMEMATRVLQSNIVNLQTNPALRTAATED